jgi:tripartite-type tricarboxylate transporter receptor subunit TctC
MEKLKFLVALCAGLVAFPAVAQTYPERPVRIVVTLSPGSTSDILARVVGDQMSKGLGQPVVIENRPGAGGNVAGAAVKATAPDGYTLMLATISSHGINPALYAKMPYDALKDFAPIALLGSSPNVLIAGPGVPASSVKELIAVVKSGNHNFASAGNGTSHHLSAELFNAMIGAKGTHIPYKGSPEAVTAVMKGDVTFMFPNAPNAVSLAKSGKLKLLAVTTPKRVSWLPDVPTVAESGLPGFDVTAWFGLVALAGTPEPIIQKLNAEANKALGVQSVRDTLVNQGFELMGGSAKEMGDFMRAEIEKWTRVVKISGAKVE